MLSVLISQLCIGFANKLAPVDSVSEGIFRAEHESFHHVRFSRTSCWKPLKVAFLAIFKKIVELSTDVLELSLLSEIDNLSSK